mmetsp:Transcript_100140/g.283532  ORF Transcript_100140/g.283532 Transcript_100140/m.283532 type:complete len:243 (+) Transcript_100140:563-1291(+)
MVANLPVGHLLGLHCLRLHDDDHDPDLHHVAHEDHEDHLDHHAHLHQHDDHHLDLHQDEHHHHHEPDVLHLVHHHHHDPVHGAEPAVPHHGLPAQHHLRRDLHREDPEPHVRRAGRARVHVPLRERRVPGARPAERVLRPPVRGLRAAAGPAQRHRPQGGLRVDDLALRPESDRWRRERELHPGLQCLRRGRLQQETRRRARGRHGRPAPGLLRRRRLQRGRHGAGPQRALRGPGVHGCARH